MPTRHTISHADEIYKGDVHYAPYSPDGRRGIKLGNVFFHSFGAPIAIDDDSLVTGATGAAKAPNANTLTFTVATATSSSIIGTNSTWVIATPRNLTLKVTHGSSIVAMTAVVTGTDLYGDVMSELFTITATGTSKTATGKKAFATVTSVAVTSASNAEANTWNIGHADTLGVPVRFATLEQVLVIMDGASVASTTVVADDTAATTSTGDVRGTVLPGTATNGTRRFSVWVAQPDTTSKERAFGIDNA